MQTNEKKIKVLQICAVGFTAQKFLLPLVDEMSKTYDVSIACSADSITDILKEKGYKIYDVNIARKIDIISNIKTVINLYKLFCKEKFEVVHVHTPVAGILGRIAAKLARVPIIIYTAHGFYFHDNMPLLKKNFYIFIEKIGGMISDYIFTQSTEDYETGIRKKIISVDKILAIGNGIDIKKFDLDRIKKSQSITELRNKLGFLENDIVIGLVGRVVKEKGYIEWVEAANIIFNEYKNVKFVSIGDTLESDRDGVKRELNNYIQQHGLLKNIYFLGNRNDIPEMLSIIDIFTLPSYREGMPRSLIEAMSMSKPAIATNIRGCREEVIEGETGFLVPVGDSKALAEKIIYLIKHPELRSIMGINARLRVESEFDENIVIQKQLNIIAKLVINKIK